MDLIRINNRYIMRIIIIFFMLIFSIETHASVNCLKVYNKIGQQEIIPIGIASEITFGDQTMNIGSYEFLLKDILRYEFCDLSDTGISEISDKISEIKINPSGIITFPHTITENVNVYNSKGIIQNVKVHDTVIDLTQLQSDMYLIVIGQSALKFLKI